MIMATWSSSNTRRAVHVAISFCVLLAATTLAVETHPEQMTTSNAHNLLEELADALVGNGPDAQLARARTLLHRFQKCAGAVLDHVSCDSRDGIEFEGLASNSHNSVVVPKYRSPMLRSRRVVAESVASSSAAEEGRGAESLSISHLANLNEQHNMEFAEHDDPIDVQGGE
jgi:hypothetical protein